MKEQVKSVILETDEKEINGTKQASARYLFEQCVIRRVSDGGEQSVKLEQETADALLDKIVALIGAQPQPAVRPYRNTLVLKNLSKITVPRAELEQLMENAWAEARDYDRCKQDILNRPTLPEEIVTQAQQPAPETAEHNVQEKTEDLKAQIVQVIWCEAAEAGDTGACRIEAKINGSRCKMFKQDAAGENTAMMNEGRLQTFLDRICEMLSREPDINPEEEPRRSEVILQDGTKKYLPWETLKSFISEFWDDAFAYTRQVMSMTLAGAVACQTKPEDTLAESLGFGMLRQQEEKECPAPEEQAAEQEAAPEAAPAPASAAQTIRIDKDTWNCACGKEGLHGKFCPECGNAAPPVLPETWNCPQCGAKDMKGKFCRECGAKRPVVWNCACGRTGLTGKFCPDCGKPQQG